MRLILLLIALLAVGFLVQRNLSQQQETLEQSNLSAPESARDLESLESDVNEYVLDAANKRNEDIDNIVDE